MNAKLEIKLNLIPIIIKICTFLKELKKSCLDLSKLIRNKIRAKINSKPLMIKTKDTLRYKTVIRLNKLNLNSLKLCKIRISTIN